jgi:hypothetical protein
MFFRFSNDINFDCIAISETTILIVAFVVATVAVIDNLWRGIAERKTQE